MSVTATKLDSVTTLYTPEKAISHELIILCTWLGASKKHIPKYIALYQLFAPKTPILLVESSVVTITRPYPAQLRSIQPAVSVLLRTLESGASHPTGPKILLHTFSNGGSNSATQLLIAAEAQRKEPLALQGLICDSTPAKGEYWKSYHSVIISLPKSLVWKVLGPPLAHWIVGAMQLGAAMGRYPLFETLIRETMVGDVMVKGRDRSNGEQKEGEKKIALLWSKTDEVVNWKDVVEYADEAKEKGWEVDSVEFEGSGHCGHLRVDADRYGSVLREMWERS